LFETTWGHIDGLTIGILIIVGNVARTSLWLS